MNNWPTWEGGEHLQIVDCRRSYIYLVRWLIDHGHHVTSRGLSTRERTGVTLVLPTPAADDAVMLPIGVNRGVNPRLAAVEALQLIGGGSYPSLVEAAAPKFNDVLVDQGNPDFGAYGPRVNLQVEDIYNMLNTDPTTRRAVLTIWRTEDLTHDGDRPCTLTLQFLIRDDLLELHVNMRSQDVWLGTPYDLFMFTQLQLTMARQLKIAAGKYVHHIGSFHIYETDVERAQQLIDVVDDAPIPELPRGVVANGRDHWTFNVADSLIAGVASIDEYAGNQWYTTQISRLRTKT